MENNSTAPITDWILMNNNQIIAFNKPAGIAVQKDESEDLSLHQLGEIYCKHPLFVVHRLDRVTSGVVVFAKKAGSAKVLSQHFKDRVTEKTYLAVVENAPEPADGTLSEHLYHKKGSNKSYIVEEAHKYGQAVLLSYKTLVSSDNYFLLEVRPISGRTHQIRTQLGHIKCPVKGDVKYGARRSNKDRSIHLHAWKLSFPHPVTEEKIHLEAPIPSQDSLWKFFEEQMPS